MNVKEINNHITGLLTTNITDIVNHCDEHTNTDEEFYKAFTQAIFDRFGWSYHIKNEDQSKIDQRAFEDYSKTELIASYHKQ